MKNGQFPFGRQNLDYVEVVLEQYRQDPTSVDPSWIEYFKRTEGGDIQPMGVDDEPTGTDEHLIADTHPIIHRAGDHEVLQTPTVVSTSGDTSGILAVLQRIPLFHGLSAKSLSLIASIAEEIKQPADVYLGHTGSAANDLYYICEGWVSILRGDEVLTELGPGELVGELAVFDSRPRSADIRTKENCHLYRIDRNKLHQLLAQNSDLSLGLLKALTTRLRDAGNKQERVDALVNAYRERGHVMAELDPLGFDPPKQHPELTLEHYGLSEKDMEMKFTVKIGKVTSGRSLGDIHRTLNRIYCRSIGAQFMHIDDLDVQDWLRIQLEEKDGQYTMKREAQLRILKKLTDAEVFENFIHRKFVGAKRFSLEGAESLIPLLDIAIDQAARHEIEEVIIGMAHRGRLNVMVNIMEKPAAQVFREFLDIDPDLHVGRGDVKYHLGYGTDIMAPSGNKVHLSLCFNPSHLEFVGPVVLGRARAKQDRFGDTERKRALPLIIHGDAAIAGQGVVQEMLNLSELPGYRTGGTVHIVLNNQIGFTTDPSDSRSTQYCTDVARMLQIPIFHVNGEHPEAVAAVMKLAMDFRAKFARDVVIDMYSYRKYGHNEGDDPGFTQPLLYQHIKRRKTVREAFVDNLLKLGGITKDEAKKIAEESKAGLERDLENSRDDSYRFKHHSAGTGLWAPFQVGPDQAPEVDTSLTPDQAVELLEKISTVPDGFTPHKKIQRFLNTQLDMAKGDVPLNWGAAEAMALGSIMLDKYTIRLAGQDAERGTFSHRHAVWHDAKTGEKYTPLANLSDDQAKLELYNSPLTETAVLGFEYGYSLDTPDGLILWEAQFGDFSNVAQVIIDQFISSSEEKWQRLSGITMLLPHGFEGQGPEHSSARLERWLMLAAADNIRVLNLTTPAQIFHCLRRQVLRKVRKPMVIMSPKSLLRHPRAVSSMEEISEGRFQKVIGDDLIEDKSTVERVLLCSGKVYYDLLAHREEHGLNKVAILRMEQYYPLPFAELEAQLKPYPTEVPVVWVQEEPLNMGAWSFLRLRLGEQVMGNGVHPLRRVTRPEAASPATGSAASHRIEQEQLMKEAFDLSCLPV